MEKQTVAGQVAADTLSYLSQFLKPGITTLEIDQKAKEFIESRNCTPAFLNYLNFPNSVCISINEEVVHCVPSHRQLEEGDIITLDLGAKFEELNSDTAHTFTVGEVKPEVQKFLDTGYKALVEGIKQAIPGNHVNNISSAVEHVIKDAGYGVVKEFIGHGIGRRVHEGPPIPNFLQGGKSPLLVKDMVICIEPILTMDPTGKVLHRGKWNTFTETGSYACHYEHMIHITDNGPVVLTKKQNETF